MIPDPGSFKKMFEIANVDCEERTQTRASVPVESGTNKSGDVGPARVLKTESAREDFEERAAIMEFDGGLSRDDAGRAAWGLISKRHQPPGKALKFTTIGDLLSEPEEQIRWVVQDRLVSGGLSVLAGKPKAGKSTLARHLALCVARGQDWLGFSTVAGPVFYLGLEEKRSEVKRHFKRMGAVAGDAVSVFIAPSPKDGLQQLRNATTRERPVLIIVDPLWKLLRVRDSNEYAAVTQALEPLLTLARETGAHILCVHHMGKGERSGGDAILGSTAIYAAVDTAMLLKRSDKYRTVSSSQRYGDDMEETVLEMEQDKMTIFASQSRKEADEAEAADAILEYLQGQTESVEEKLIHEAVEARKSLKVKAIRSLVSQGKIERTGKGGRTDPYRYFSSCSLVPTYIREQENKNGEIDASDSTHETSSCSQQTANFSGFVKSREQEKVTEAVPPLERETKPSRGYPASGDEV